MTTASATRIDFFINNLPDFNYFGARAPRTRPVRAPAGSDDGHAEKHCIVTDFDRAHMGIAKAARIVKLVQNRTATGIQAFSGTDASPIITA
jgi:hypothetical protein